MTRAIYRSILDLRIFKAWIQIPFFQEIGSGFSPPDPVLKFVELWPLNDWTVKEYLKYYISFIIFLHREPLFDIGHEFLNIRYVPCMWLVNDQDDFTMEGRVGRGLLWKIFFLFIFFIAPCEIIYIWRKYLIGWSVYLDVSAYRENQELFLILVSTTTTQHLEGWKLK